MKFKILENVKAKIRSRWENLEASSNSTPADTDDEFSVDDPSELDPLEAMLNLREAQRNNAVESSSSPLELEFKKYESMPKTKKDVNPLTWWHSKKDELPLLFKIAQEVLSIPISSSKSERIFSTAGRVNKFLQERFNFLKFILLVD